ncbi:MAG: YcaQ family DNA glycosylase [Candidatus Eremiobacteraeota bacterium]|nr:YcaQ family DNA glycosylase [Candidatus Eremiobacteraeota bacterium]
MLSKDEARRLALLAQGFYDPIPAKPARAALNRVLQRVGIFQIDSVNVLVRSHYLPLFSRVGPYPMTLLRDAAWGPRSKRRLFEYWAHEASLIPLELRPLFAWRMQRARDGYGTWKRVAAIRRRKAFVQSVRKRIEDEGPATASSFKDARGRGSWWGWSDVKIALEYLFWSGELTTAKRTTSFERVYDLPERVFGEAVLTARIPSADEAHRQLVLRALRSMGVATESDLRDYFRLDVAGARAALHDLLDAGAIVATSVDGWKQPAYVLPDARIPRKDPQRTALLSPFDSLVWKRDRAHRLFDFHYRIEIYTPAHKRIHGYYVLPLLHDGKLVGRVDLKADRESGRLVVKGEHYESGVSSKPLRGALGEQLQALAVWLGLDSAER